jgi:hypothetical protein
MTDELTTTTNEETVTMGLELYFFLLEEGLRTAEREGLADEFNQLIADTDSGKMSVADLMDRVKEILVAGRS